MKREDILQICLWGLVTYSGAILAYYTFKVRGHNADYISAFGSILSAVFTIFTAFIAVFIFSKWKKQTIYLDGIRIIKDINLEVRNIFLDLEQLRKYFDYYNQCRDLAYKIKSERKFSKEDIALLPGDEIFKYILNFKQGFLPVHSRINNLKNLFDQLGDLTRQDTQGYFNKIRELLFVIEKDFTESYTLLIQYWVGVGSTNNPDYPRAIDNSEFIFLQSVLENQMILTEHLSEKNIAKYQNYFVTHRIEDEQESEYKTFTYDTVIQDKKSKIFNCINGFRHKYLE